MESLVYITLASFYFFIGVLVFFKNLRLLLLKVFIIVCITLPIVNFTQPYHFKYQISVYNFFFIGIYAYYFLKILISFRLSRRIIAGVILTLSLLFIYILHYIFLVNESRELTDILKDIKPFITIATAYLFADFFKRELRLIFSERLISGLLLINFISSSFLYYFMFKYDLNISLSGDAYYKYNELRYLSLGTYFCIFYLISRIISGNFPSIKNLLLSIIPLLYTGNRTLIVTLFVTVSIYYLLRLSLKRIIIFFSGILVIGLGFIEMVKRAEENSALFRFKELTDIGYVMDALSNRISPFTNELHTISFTEGIFGKGLGFSFYIPWFEYRVNIENYNIYLDNLYLTLLAKFGIFSILLFVIINDYIRNYCSGNQKIFYILFFLLLSFTNAVFYQFYFLWFLIMLVFPFLSTSKEGELNEA
ncbi:hypothetical protein ATE92_1056 [Ulvibacter sp. MAR_2010_11]|uniref:DUF6369 family protein n=1 Tax=Ulvibacter sp. MAR_2010_11 TaxID=1250229 RepID=UPI000C2BE35C|nr:DUF6369 family protein [Ulvibacter sp. MAR_2010_11]PKA82915.1 hypothetical protein ATE92_1056 [Ulvibacter sp. MAR_2010_11]